MRDPKLDFLRFIGVTLVMFNHLSYTGNSFVERIMGKLCIGGWIGVDIFFVLSGFLVSGLIFKEYDKYQSFDVPHFLIRRGLKIYPTFYVFLGLSYAASAMFTSVFPHDTLQGLLHEATFTSNYLSFNNGPLWSICIEEHFYFFLAILFFILIKFQKLNLRYVLATYFVLFIATSFFRYQNYISHNDYNFYRDYSRTHFRVDSLFCGVLLFYTYNYHKAQLTKFLSGKLNYVLLAISFLFMASNFMLTRYDHRWMSVVNLALHPIFVGCIMLNFLEGNNERVNKLIRPFAYIGKYSYPIYLFHGRINEAVFHFFTGYKYYIVYFLLSIIIGILVSKIIEYPVLQLRDRYFPSKSKALTAAPVHKKRSLPMISFD